MGHGAAGVWNISPPPPNRAYVPTNATPSHVHDVIPQRSPSPSFHNSPQSSISAVEAGPLPPQHQGVLALHGPNSSQPPPQESITGQWDPVGNFDSKLVNVLNNPAYRRWIYWSKDGKGITIPDEVSFCRHVLPRLSKSKRFTAFVKQLNNYGFQRLNGATRSNRDTPKELKFEPIIDNGSMNIEMAERQAAILANAPSPSSQLPREEPGNSLSTRRDSTSGKLSMMWNFWTCQSDFIRFINQQQPVSDRDKILSLWDFTSTLPAFRSYLLRSTQTNDSGPSGHTRTTTGPHHQASAPLSMTGYSTAQSPGHFAPLRHAQAGQISSALPGRDWFNQSSASIPSPPPQVDAFSAGRSTSTYQPLSQPATTQVGSPTLTFTELMAQILRETPP